MTVELKYEARPWTLNEERAGHRYQRASRTKKWRRVFCDLAKSAATPCLTNCTVTATPYQLRGRMQDVAACVPAVKAAIDGLVDAGVLVDDSPKYLHAIVFNQPRKGKPALHLRIDGDLATEGQTSKTDSGRNRGDTHGVGRDHDKNR
jgi:hypothetical protein